MSDYDPNNEKHFYQTDALSEEQCSLISEALKAELAREENGVNNPSKISDLTELIEMFSDPSGNLIEVDAPDEDEDEDEDEE